MTKDSGMGLFSEGEAIDTVVNRIRSGEWWVFVFSFRGSSTSPIFHKIENKYYTPGTSKNRDFEMMLGFDVNYIFAKKTRMNKSQLGEILLNYLTQTSVGSEQREAQSKEIERVRTEFMNSNERDVIPIVDYDNPHAAIPIMKALVELDDYMGKQISGT